MMQYLYYDCTIFCSPCILSSACNASLVLALHSPQHTSPRHLPCLLLSMASSLTALPRVTDKRTSSHPRKHMFREVVCLCTSVCIISKLFFQYWIFGLYHYLLCLVFFNQAEFSLNRHLSDVRISALWSFESVV